MPVVISVAIASFLEKISIGEKNPKISRMTEIDKHKTYGFSIFVKFTKKI